MDRDQIRAEVSRTRDMVERLHDDTRPSQFIAALHAVVNLVDNVSRSWPDLSTEPKSSSSPSSPSRS